MVSVLACLQLSFAQVRSSANYQLQSDSVNIGGGLSSSGSYTQESTVGEIATGVGSSTNYQLRAGYQQMQEVYISLTTGGDVFLAPDITAITGGISDGYTQVTVTTDSPTGYALTIEAGSDPAMKSGSNSILDYHSNQFTPYAEGFNIAPLNNAFGYAPFGSDVVEYFRDDAIGNCGSGGVNSTPLTCWEGLTISPVTISQGTNSNHPFGVATDIDFRVEVQAGAGIVAGDYLATTTLTALPL
jgi:hypothetical protein